MSEVAFDDTDTAWSATGDDADERSQTDGGVRVTTLVPATNAASVKNVQFSHKLNDR